MKYSENFLKRLTAYFLSAGVILFTAVGCGSSNEDQTAETATEEPVEQPAEPMEEPASEQSAIEEVETQEVVNPAPAIDRGSQEFARLEAMKEANRNNEVLAEVNVRYGDWDNDGDNVLNENEFYEGLYSVWDKDGNDVVNEEEFQRATENLFVNYDFDEYGEFTDWDSDGNGELTNQEFTSGMQQSIETNQDATAVNRLFTVWDLDNDEKIERIQLRNVTVLLDADDN